MSLTARGFQFFLHFTFYLSLGQIQQLGDTFQFFLLFCDIHWSYEERERRKEGKEEDGGEVRGEGKGRWRVGGEDRGEDRGGDRREDRRYRGRIRSY